MSNAVEEFLAGLHREILRNRDGEVADYIPELAQVDPDLFGLALSTLDGALYSAGDAATTFTIQSASKPFVMALAIQDRGVDGLLAAVGVEPTGDPFNAVTLEEGTGRPLNPMVNAGAIVTASLVAGADGPARSERILGGLSAFAGRPLEIDERVFASELATGDRNRALAFLMRSMGSLTADVDETLEVYFRQCSTLVTAEDLALMAATLANGGRNPLTGELVVQPDVVTHVLSVMITCGLYDFSGEWMFSTGLPAKSGVGGGIAVVLPGQFGIATFSPRLDAQGNSVRGVAACEALSRQLGLHVMRPRAQGAPPVHRRLHGDEVHSTRSRPARERAVLTGATEALVVYELQGDLTFREAELLSRRAAEESARWLILDAGRVERIDPVASGLLRATASALAERGVDVLFSGPWDLLSSGSPASTAGAKTFPSAADAVEACEDVLVVEAGLPGPADEISLADNDLCHSLPVADVEVLEAHGVRLDFRKGDVIAPTDGLDYPLMFITRGRIDLERRPGSGAPPSSAPLRFTSRSAGTAAGSLAVFESPTMRTRLAAAADTAVVALDAEALRRLHDAHPRIVADLFRAAAEALAAEYRWTAAENAALVR